MSKSPMFYKMDLLFVLDFYLSFRNFSQTFVWKSQFQFN